MIISKTVWGRYQSLRSAQFEDGRTVLGDQHRRAEILRLHLALFYDIGPKPAGILEGELLDVPRPWVKFRRSLDDN